jgi:hypothetical protein
MLQRSAFLSTLLLGSVTMAFGQAGTPAPAPAPPPSLAQPQHSVSEMGKTQTLLGCLIQEPTATSAIPNINSSGNPQGQNPPNINSPGNPQAKTQPNINSPGTPQVSPSRPAETQGLKSPSAAEPVTPATPPRFSLRRQGNNEEITVEGLPTQLTPHVGHTVQLTGMLTQKNGRDVLTVGMVRHVANSCDSKPATVVNPD